MAQRAWLICSIVGALMTMMMQPNSVEGVEVLAPFQVSVRLHEMYNTPMVVPGNPHLCNGVIFSGKYILTAASCMYVPTMYSQPSQPINPTMIYIVAGNFTYNGGNDAVKRYVVSIIVHDKYNPNSVDNDIAILKLDRSLPLNNDIQWIRLDDGKAIRRDCFQTLFNDFDGQMTATTTHYPYSIGKNATILDSWICEATNTMTTTNNNVTLTRTNDFCLQFAVTNVHFCNASLPGSKRYAKQNIGTALVCENKLTGLLATVNQPANPINCQTSKKTTAHYTRIAPFIDWIHFEVGFNQTASTQTSLMGLQPVGWSPSPTSSSVYSSNGDTATPGKGPHRNLSSSTKTDILIIVSIACLNYIFYYLYTHW